MERKRILIVGGVAGGASCAARARRLCERCQIVVFDRGPYVSFANCGLPYFVGNVIEQEEKLLVATPQLFRERFNIEVHTETEVTEIDTDGREIEVRDLATGQIRRERYDALILSPGARAIRPPLDGIDLPGIFVLRTIPDSREIRAALKQAGSAIIVGGGFIGLEMAENLLRHGLEVTVVEMADQVMPPLDPEMAAFVAERLRSNGVSLHLGNGVEGFERRDGGGLTARLSSGERLGADMVVLAIGVRPETTLAEKAGIEIGERGGIKVDDSMRTSAPRVWAVGDAIEVRDIVTGTVQPMPLAGPANRQGRIAAASALAEIYDREEPFYPTPFRGVQGTAVCGVLGITAATTGASAKALRRAGITDFEEVYLHPGNHVGYFPGATPIHLKLVFSTRDGRVLGAQAVGEDGVARRIDVIASMIQNGATVHDLEEAELCYAPQYGAAKDPVNLAGMIAANHLRGGLPLAAWNELGKSPAQIIDVRSAAEWTNGHIEGAVNIPLEELRGRLDEIDRDHEVWLICGVGQRAYYATRVLLQNGYRVRNLSGGMQTYNAFESAKP
jgi:NADPH-dependent 2,4-dienoyl-CoA reductase/sulfur reductase-like enzyme/rhodanese-related sulfurtransferase